MNFPSMMRWDLSELQKFRSQLDAFRKQPRSSNEQASGLAIDHWRQTRKTAEHEHDVKFFFSKNKMIHAGNYFSRAFKCVSCELEPILG